MKPAIALAVLALTPLLSSGAPADADEFGAPTGPGPIPALDPYLSRVRENVSRSLLAENISHEDVRIALDMDFRTLDFDALGVLFGGGTFEAQGRLTAAIEIRSLGLYRVNDALNASTQGRLNLSLTPAENDVNRTHLTADELRTALAGEGLAVFQQQQAAAAEAFISEAFPDMTVLSSRVGWSNVNPMSNRDGDDPGDPTDQHLLEPPIRLDVVFDLQSLRRESLANLVDQARAHAEKNEPDDPEERLLDQLKERQQAAFYERSAFSVLGLTQLLNLGMSPGWDLVLTLRLPEGYTFEEASPDVAVGQRRRSAQVVTLAGDAETEVYNPVLVSISNRYMVSASLLAVTLLVGAILRFPATLVWGRARAFRRVGKTLVIPVLAAPGRAIEENAPEARAP